MRLPRIVKYGLYTALLVGTISAAILYTTQNSSLEEKLSAIKPMKPDVKTQQIITYEHFKEAMDNW